MTNAITPVRFAFLVWCDVKITLNKFVAEFMTSGQNLHSAGSKPDFAPIESIISGSVNGWYKEIKDASQANIDKFGTPAK